jgi:SAM-dependent methyltransferase
MDPATLAAYDAGAAAFATDWQAQPAPTDLHVVVRRYFGPGLTADIGCGSGREVGWLVANGFQAMGYDPSASLLDEARTRHPDLAFASATLPQLAELRDDSFDNVLCETVIMHLPREQIADAVARLLSIVRPGGVMYLSWRVTEGADRRDAQGRLYTAFPSDLVRQALGDAAVLLDEEVTSASSGRKIHRMVARKNAAV